MSSVPEHPNRRGLGPEWDDELTSLGRDLPRLLAARWLRAHAAETRAAPAPPTPKRQRKPSPSRLAKWEAHWQAESAGTDR